MDRIKATMLLAEIKGYLTAGNPVWDVDEIAEACDMAIEALRNEINCVKCEHHTERETPTGIKGVCKMDTAHREDLISRRALCQYALNQKDKSVTPNDIMRFPSAEPKTGKWKLDPDGMDWNIPAWRCSECGFVANYIGVEANGFGNNPMNWAGSKFCPQCGVRITGYERCYRMSKAKSICKKCKHKAVCDETVRLYGIPNIRVTECKAYEPKGGDSE